MGLPSSAQISDLSLRPAFLGLLQVFLEETKERGSEHWSRVGFPVELPSSAYLEAATPEGTEKRKAQKDGRSLEGIDWPSIALEISSQQQRERPILPALDESQSQARSFSGLSEATSAAQSEQKVSLTREFALLALLLAAGELILRLLNDRRRSSIASL